MVSIVPLCSAGDPAETTPTQRDPAALAITGVYVPNVPVLKGQSLYATV